MPTVRGKAEVAAFIARVPTDLETKVLRGAARAAANVVADEARERSISEQVTNAIKVATSKEETRVVAKVQVKGEGAFIAPWLEYGTAPHFISVAEDQRQGMGIRRINQKQKEGSLVIGDKFVGPTVFHPGARPHPFLRPALDVKESEAIAAAQAYIDDRVTPSGIAGSAEQEGDDQ
jgi:HK97 gp10 family phage protein